ncbi:hypothetical protein [uncultured Eubacterium sp.]|uniref:hypothetical protein n=1 Tax=uncultured Eubacterium sp. TaxID=165185 RepID=UPI0025969C02|nr:hypothetical protein [uncultured Eubacterium sp.]
MVRAENCINVYIDNYLDFVITIEPDEDYAKAYEVVEKAEEEWFEDTHESDEPISEWIGEKLTENEIEYEMYFKSEVEEDDE